MSRQREIDSGRDRGGYVDHDRDQTSSRHSSIPRVSELEHYSTGDPPFPEVNEHPGTTIPGTNSITSPKCSSRNVRVQADERLRMRLKFLEDSNTVMQTRNLNLITENRALIARLREESKMVAELRSRLREIEALKVPKPEDNPDKGSRVECEERITETKDVAINSDEGVQCWAVCLACDRKLKGNETLEPTVTITKCELEGMEKDIRALKDAVLARQEAWDKAMEREESYRQQIMRLSADTVTSRHLSESRYSELKALAVALKEKEDELKATRKDLLSFKKIIVKLDRRQREFEEHVDGVNAEGNLGLMSETEQKIVSELVTRRPTRKAKPRHKSKNASSASSTPRTAKSNLDN